MNKKLLALALFLGTLSSHSFAGTISSDACAPGARDFTVTTAGTASCLAVGAGNINGNGNQADGALLSSGWVFVDKSDTTDGAHNGWLDGIFSGASGSFTIDAAAYSAYDRIAIGFKSGNGQIDPDWAVFELADGTVQGTWTVSSQGMSHAILYGFGTGTPVPEPGSLALLGIGLLGLLRRRGA